MASTADPKLDHVSSPFCTSRQRMKRLCEEKVGPCLQKLGELLDAELRRDSAAAP